MYRFIDFGAIEPPAWWYSEPDEDDGPLATNELIEERADADD